MLIFFCPPSTVLRTHNTDFAMDVRTTAVYTIQAVHRHSWNLRRILGLFLDEFFLHLVLLLAKTGLQSSDPTWRGNRI